MKAERQTVPMRAKKDRHTDSRPDSKRTDASKRTTLDRKAQRRNKRSFT